MTRRRLLLISLIPALAVILPGATGAQSCSSRIDEALAELKRVVPDMDILQLADARGVLKELCEGPRQTAAASVESDEIEPEPDPDATQVLGLEINKAPPDAKGHDRLKRTH